MFFLWLYTLQNPFLILLLDNLGCASISKPGKKPSGLFKLFSKSICLFINSVTPPQDFRSRKCKDSPWTDLIIPPSSAAVLNSLNKQVLIELCHHHLKCKSAELVVGKVWNLINCDFVWQAIPQLTTSIRGGWLSCGALSITGFIGSTKLPPPTPRLVVMLFNKFIEQLIKGAALPHVVALSPNNSHRYLLIWADRVVRRVSGYKPTKPPTTLCVKSVDCNLKG